MKPGKRWIDVRLVAVEVEPRDELPPGTEPEREALRIAQRSEAAPVDAAGAPPGGGGAAAAGGGGVAITAKSSAEEQATRIFTVKTNIVSLIHNDTQSSFIYQSAPSPWAQFSPGLSKRPHRARPWPYSHKGLSVSGSELLHPPHLSCKVSSTCLLI